MLKSTAMKVLIKKLNKYGNSFRYIELNMLRVVLGIIIFYKGIFFMKHTDLLMDLIRPVDFGFTEGIIFHYVTMAHIAGGILIFFGLLTRIAVIIQIPILIGAVIANAIVGDNFQLVLSVSILSLLVFFAIVGSGKISADYELQMHM